GGVDAPDDARHLADLRRALPRARAKVRAEVEGHADQPDVDTLRIRDPGRAHEGRDFRETRHHAGIERLQIWRVVHPILPKTIFAWRLAPSGPGVNGARAFTSVRAARCHARSGLAASWHK